MKGREDHSGSADAALCSAAVEKRLLQQFQAAVRSQAFDRDDLRAFGLKRRDEAAVHQRSVDQNGARAALAFATPFFRSGQAKLVAQDVEQALHRVHVDGFELSVDRKRYFAFGLALGRFAHSRPPASRTGSAEHSGSAAKISSGSSGIEWKETCSASSTALIIAGAGPSIGSSPIPFAPYAP